MVNADTVEYQVSACTEQDVLTIGVYGVTV